MPSKALAAIAVLGLLTACSTTYKPSVVDAKTGLHTTLATVDAGGVIASKTAVRFADYGAVLLVARSNAYPSRLEFLARKELAEMGFDRVVNVAEFRRWADDAKFELPVDKIGIAEIRKFSSTVKPVLVVDVQYGWVGGARHFAGARIVDGRTGESMLTVDHPKTVWLNADDEVIYPMLNELRKWRKRVDSQSS